MNTPRPRILAPDEAGQPGDLIGFAQQKRLEPKEEIFFFTDETKTMCRPRHAGVEATHSVHSRRTPRMQVYLPDELCDAVKERELSPSELLQVAVRAELRHQALLEETDRYLAELIDDIGEPSDEVLAKAEALSRRIQADKTPPP